MIALAPIAAVVAALVSPSVPVVCQPGLASQHHQSGTVEWSQQSQTVSAIVLDAGICANYRSRNATEAASALLIVLHEAEHAALESPDEAQVECHALRLVRAFTTPVFARELGGDPAAWAAARRLAARYYAVARLVDAGMPAWYHLAPGQECAP